MKFYNPAYDIRNKKQCEKCNGQKMIDYGCWHKSGIPLQGNHSNFGACDKCHGYGYLVRNYDGMWISKYKIVKYYDNEAVQV